MGFLEKDGKLTKSESSASILSLGLDKGPDSPRPTKPLEICLLKSAEGLVKRLSFLMPGNLLSALIVNYLGGLTAFKSPSREYYLRLRRKI